MASVSIGQIGELHIQLVGEVGDQRAFGARIMHRRNTAAARPAVPRENSSRVSVNSARSLTCTAPVAAQNACHAACSPASAPECAATIARPRGEPPTVRITTGTSCSAARSSACRSRGTERGVSINSAMIRVSGSSSA